MLALLRIHRPVLRRRARLLLWLVMSLGATACVGDQDPRRGVVIGPAGIPDGGLTCAPAAAVAQYAQSQILAADEADAGSVDAQPSDVAFDTGSIPDARVAVPPVGARKIVVISIDGLRPDALFRAPAPNILKMACGAAFSWQARTIRPSITLPSHASMVSGFPPEVHQLYHNDLRPGFIPVPTFLAQAHAAGKKTVMVVGKEKLIQLAIPGSIDVYVWEPSDEQVIAQAVVEIKAGFDALFIHLPLVDVFGHTNAWMSAAYLERVARTDAALQQVFEALPPDVHVILTADHGGHDYNHGEGLPVDVHIPWIAWGPLFRKGHLIEAPVSTMDTAATAARVLGVTLGSGAQGVVVQEAFE